MERRSETTARRQRPSAALLGRHTAETGLRHRRASPAREPLRGRLRLRDVSALDREGSTYVFARQHGQGAALELFGAREAAWCPRAVVQLGRHEGAILLHHRNIIVWKALIRAARSPCMNRS